MFFIQFYLIFVLLNTIFIQQACLYMNVFLYIEGIKALKKLVTYALFFCFALKSYTVLNLLFMYSCQLMYSYSIFFCLTLRIFENF